MPTATIPNTDAPTITNASLTFTPVGNSDLADLRVCAFIDSQHVVATARLLHDDETAQACVADFDVHGALALIVESPVQSISTRPMAKKLLPLAETLQGMIMDGEIARRERELAYLRELRTAFANR